MNTKGTGDADKELRSLLDYFESMVPQDDFTGELDEAVATAKLHKEWRREYMTLERMMMDSRREGKAEGKAEGKEIHLIELIQKKVRKGKSLAQTAEEIEERENDIRDFFEAVCAAPEKTAEEILNTFDA